MKLGKNSWRFDNGVYLDGNATVTGPREAKGPLSKTFDYSFDDLYCNEKTWEKAEQALLKKSIEITLSKTNIRQDAVDLLISGDLMNQTISSNYVARELDAPFIGIFGACSTSMEGVALGSALIDGGQCTKVIASTSSHQSSAERQFRYPTEYGIQKPNTAHTTVTGAGSVLLKNEKTAIQVEGATIGKVIDYGMTDPLDMGSAMAPAAANTIVQHFKDFGRQPEDYDYILTGDLASIGTPILKKMTEQSGYDIEDVHQDCGLMIYHAPQKVNSGGSGCASSAVVTYGYILQQMIEEKIDQVLVVATGALFSPTSVQQKESIPCIAHGVVMKRVKDI